MPETPWLHADPSAACDSVDFDEDVVGEVAFCSFESGALGVVYAYPGTSGHDGVAGLTRAVEADSGSRVEG